MSNLSALHQYPNGSEPDAVSEQARAANQQEQTALQSYKDWQAKSVSSVAAQQVFAANCLLLWQRYKSQGSRKGSKGFKRVLRGLCIPERAAYRAMWAAFPTERPTSQPNAAKLLPLPRLDLKLLKSFSRNGDAFQQEFSLHDAQLGHHQPHTTQGTVSKPTQPTIPHIKLEG
jgi:hypothetical protein